MVLEVGFGLPSVANANAFATTLSMLNVSWYQSFARIYLERTLKDHNLMVLGQV